jgi:hypothetical protein
MKTKSPTQHYPRAALMVMVLLATGLVFSGFGQSNGQKTENSHGVTLTAITCDSLVPADSTLSIKVFAENKGADVVEAIVSLVDSASGDTLEYWYPLFPPESADSIVMFWNTKGTKAGSHTLSAVVVSPATGNNPASVKVSRTTTVVR